MPVALDADRKTKPDAMTVHLRLLAERAQEALENHARMADGLERSIRDATTYGLVVGA